jgi:hypothetical protein
MSNYNFFNTEESGNGEGREEFCNPLNSAEGQRNWLRGTVEKYAERVREDGCSKKEAKLYIMRCFENGWEKASDAEELRPEIEEELQAFLKMIETFCNDKNRQVRELGQELREPITVFLRDRNYSFNDWDELQEKVISSENKSEQKADENPPAESSVQPAKERGEL